MTLTSAAPPAAPELARGGLREFVRDRLVPVAAEFERAHRFPQQLLRDLADLGILRRAFEHDGSSEFYYRAVEILAEGWVAVAESLNLQVLAARPLAGFGPADLRAELLPGMTSMRLIAGNCISEPEAGSDLSDLKTVAVEDGDDFVLSGTKRWVGHAPVADLFNVFCRTGGTGLGGVSCLLVDRAAAGVSVGPPESKMGVQSLPTADVVFDAVRVPRRRLIGRKNRGMVVAADLFDHGRLGLAACAIGLSEAALRYSASYAKRRVQFGRPVIQFQGVSFLLADMATSIAAARALTRAAVRAVDAATEATLLASQAKLFATDTAMRVTTDAVQVLGAYGYSTDHPVERWMREAKLLQIIQGTNQIQRQTIASYL
ncbi:acyl-CoA dehydrogenase family protein [Jatrophihabitans sp.]|uniref:acyl-CoA dehydrogenase family protein n=1 Tax=Jatrophihabitans sp. TaxID=1932789 RepID=UPI002EE0D723